MKKISIGIAIGLCVFIAISFLFSLRPYPYADDWTYAASVDFVGVEFWRWVFSQHVDHFIPVQKILQHCLAKMGSFDFRLLALFNLVVAIFAVVVSIGLAKIYRKQIDVGDLWIVFCVLSPNAAYLLWGFQFQFLSSVAFFLISTSFLSFGFISNKRIYFTLGLVFLILTALSGMNGLVLSVVFSATVAIGLFLHKEISIEKRLMDKILILVLCLIVIIIVVKWEPSAAAHADASLLQKLSVFYLLHSGPFSILAFGHSATFASLVIFLSLASAAFLFKKYLQNSLDVLDLFLVAALIASEALLLVVAFGRAGAQGGWSNVLLMHYGPLTFLPLIFSWIILSNFLSLKSKNILSVLLLGLFIFSYHKAYDWRQDHINKTLSKQLTVEKSLTQIFDVKEFVDEQTLELTWQDSDEQKLYVERGLTQLLSLSYPRYQLRSPYVLLGLDEADPAITVNTLNIISTSGWDGSDFDNTFFDGLRVIGSYISSDSDSGSIKLNLSRGDRLLYRSGPTYGSQGVTIEYGEGYNFVLPVSNQWSLIEFSGPNLPSNFSVEFFDNGENWGEWSAIAVIDNE